MDKSQYDTWPRKPETTKEEFMNLDLMVEEKSSPRRIVATVESELATSNRKGEIARDFEKLLSVKSAFKVMIFSAAKVGFTDERAKEALESDLRGYGHHLRGETYIFIDYNENSGDNGSFIAHIWQSRSNRQQKSAKLLPVN